MHPRISPLIAEPVAPMGASARMLTTVPSPTPLDGMSAAQAPAREKPMSERPTLGAFLRSRRERLTPAEVGLLAGGRRRTPGLRREELAILAGISVDYLVRLEQNRERRPSYSVVAALCRALRLNEDERAHLLRLAAPEGMHEMCPTRQLEPLSATTVTLLDRLETTPAVVVECSVDMTAWNHAFDILMRPTGLFDLDPPNLVRYVFLAPQARTVYRSWESEARELVARLQACAAACICDDAFDAMIRELLVTSSDFARLWASHDVLDALRPSVSRMIHPGIGSVDFNVDVLALPTRSERRLLAYVPADQPTMVAFEHLLAQSG
jgi:transcriptional regulator with XRE-family HTH domain